MTSRKDQASATAGENSNEVLRDDRPKASVSRTRAASDLASPDRQMAEQGPLRERLLWMVALWLASVLCVTILAYAIRLMIMPS